MNSATRGAALLKTPLNAALSWAITGILVVVLARGFVASELAQVALTTGVVIITVIPPLAARSPRLMLPWELLLLATVPIVAQVLPLPAATTTFVQYLSVAAFALIIVVELHAFTELSVTHGLSVALVTLTTLASAGIWAVLRYQSDQLLGTAFLTTNDALMQEFAVAIFAGLIAGIVFAAYFRRQAYFIRRRLRTVIGR